MKYPDLYIETKRLRLRPFSAVDIEDCYVMNLDSEVSRFTGDGGVVSKAEIERRIREDVLGDYEKYGYGRLAVEWKTSGKFIGFAGLKYLDDLNEVDLGYRFIRKEWGKGIATEAGQALLGFGFEKLDLEKIIAMVLMANRASINVLNKLGFKFEREITEEEMLIQLYSIHNRK